MPSPSDPGAIVFDLKERYEGRTTPVSQARLSTDADTTSPTASDCGSNDEPDRRVRACSATSSSASVDGLNTTNLDLLCATAVTESADAQSTDTTTSCQSIPSSPSCPRPVSPVAVSPERRATSAFRPLFTSAAELQPLFLMR